jgi:outer membrane receptor protein involved in Fe transport
MQTPSRSLALTLLALLGAASLHSAEDPTLQLDPLVVTGVPIELSVNPLVRPLEGVFGDARGILETPRAVSSVTQALLRERGIEGVREFIGFVAGASGPAAYGKASIPSVRGDLTETFLNGQRVSYNNFGYAPSFNNVEALDVVRGPGSAIYGSGFFTGGYVNYATKRPQFERETTVTLRLGDWVPSGGSWLNASWQIDTSAPAADGRSAWRVSYEGKDDQTFFNEHGGRDDRQDLYVAWLRRVSDTFTLEANAQYFWQAAPQLLGINRVNQELIDSGRYYTGDLPDLGYSDAGAIAGVIPGTTWVDVPRDATLLSAGDISNANVYRGQVIATAAYAPGRKLVNRTLLEHVNRRRWHAFEYGEWVEQWTAENRTEWYAAFDSGPLAHALVAGVTLRWEDRLSYTNYFNEYFFQYDLTRANPVFSHELDYPNSYWPGFAGPGGKLFFPASYGSPETTDSRLFNPAVFVQDEIKFNDRTSLLAGVRLDGFYAKARDPLGEAAGVPWEDSHSDEGVSWNASLLHKLSPRASVYATYQHALAVHGNVTGGGIMLKEDAAGNGVIDPDDFTNLSRLAEVGAKFSWLENRLYAGVALFDQRREELELGGDVKNLHMRGAEVEFVYQPDLRFNATFNVAYNDGRFDDSSASQAGGLSLYNLYALGQGPGGLGNGLGFQWDKLPPGDYRVPGLSRWVVNGSFSYTHASGFGGGLNGSWQSKQPGNLTNEYHIPDQVFLNAFLFYRQPRWEVNVDILNVLDERNWIHNGDNYSNHVLVFQDLPLRVEGYVKIRF